MILLDSSALVCAVQQENGVERLKELIGQSRIVAVGAPMVLEAGIVLSQRNRDGRHALDGFLRECQAEFLEFRREHTDVALSAFLRYGKGRHTAALNFGDCICYSYARLSGLTLVYKGHDFGFTDLAKLERLDGGSE